MRLKDVLEQLAMEGQDARGVYYKDDIEDLSEQLPHIRELAREIAAELGKFPEDVPTRVQDNGLDIEISH